MGLIQEIQDYTVVGSVGDTNQQFAGRNYSITELTTRFGVGNVDAYYNFPATDLLNDASANAENLTGVNVTDADNTTGIMNTNFGVDLNGTDEYMYEGDLWDTMPTAMAISFWFKADDGQQATSPYLIYKEGAANHRFAFYISTAGVMSFGTDLGAASLTDLFASTVLPNGACGWHHVVMNHDTTNGKRLWIDGVLEAQDPLRNTLPTGGSTSEFCIGAYKTPSNYFDGKIANFIAMDYVMTQADVDWLYATRYATPAVFGNTEFGVRAFEKTGATANPFQTRFTEIERDSDYIYRAGGVVPSTSYLRLEGVR